MRRDSRSGTHKRVSLDARSAADAARGRSGTPRGCSSVSLPGQLLLHLIQILVWALFYVWRGAMPDIATSAYFSAVTYTTTGYGDLVLPQEWRLVGGVEALTGILMCGLSTGLFFAVFSDIFGLYRGPPAEIHESAPSLRRSQRSSARSTELPPSVILVTERIRAQSEGQSPDRADATGRKNIFAEEPAARSS